MMCYSTLYKTLQDILEHYNADKSEADKLPMIPFHRLRHTSATLLIAGHEDAKTVSARLGHAETSTTLNIYAHSLPEADKTAAATIENMIAKQA